MTLITVTSKLDMKYGIHIFITTFTPTKSIFHNHADVNEVGAPASINIDIIVCAVFGCKNTNDTQEISTLSFNTSISPIKSLDNKRYYN